MTFRELLQRYKEGALDEDSRRAVAEEIDKHEAISDYLCDEAELPPLDIPLAEDDGEEARFAGMIRGAIRRAFVKMGVIVGAVTLAAVLAVVFLLPGAVAKFYYCPNDVVGTSHTGNPTTRMSLDLAVYTELFVPGAYRDNAAAESLGYGEYQITISQTASYTGRFTTVVGRLDRGQLTLYNPDVLSRPTGNAFLLPDGLRYDNLPGPAGDAEQAFAKLEELDEDEVYTAYFSLTELMDYETLIGQLGTRPWCAVYDDSSYSILGFHPTLSGSTMSWDRETYPLLSTLDSQGTHEQIQAAAESGQAMTTHYLSMLKYMRDNPRTQELFGVHTINWDKVIGYVEENGLQVYGFVVTARKDTILELAEKDIVAYVYTCEAQ